MLLPVEELAWRLEGGDRDVYVLECKDLARWWLLRV